MAEGYTVGGDSFRLLLRGRESGQTFRIATPFTLRWVDLTMKLLKPDVPPRILIYWADVHHEPMGDPVSWQTGWTLETPVSRPDWLWTEPWGQSLTQNHPWEIFADPIPPRIKLQIGILTITFTWTFHCGIVWRTPLGVIPLIHSDGRQLRICTNNVRFSSWNPLDVINHGVSLKKNGIELILYQIIKSPLWGFGSGDYGFGSDPPKYWAWKYIGEGIHDVDLLDLFYQAAPDLGLDPDPTGWSVNYVEIAHRDYYPILPSYLENDFIRLHHSHTPAYDPPIPKKDAFIPGNIYRVRFPMKPITLNPGEYYALMVDSLAWYPSDAPSWLYDKDDADYPQGHRIWRDHYMDPWTHQYNDDHLFILFGDPPAIPPPPEPPIGHWLIPDYRQTNLPDGIRIFATTNVPAHLFLYWTTKEPWVHRVAGTRRGLLGKFFAYFCFVAWHKIEQKEVGDTLEHTFDMLDWPVCETRWFVISGEVNEVKSPTISPIFKKHRTEWVTLLIEEPWTRLYLPKPDYELYFLEPWGAMPTFTHIFTEPWTRLYLPKPDYELYFREEWTS